ncbi:MAG: SpoIIE family protein phosphatase [Candidatus Cardinium sp.]|nr:MAG: SpoIIE family protein phosphatase [Candidatus Cardinium sp.]
MGDSAFIIVRNNEIKHESIINPKMPNAPYCLSLCFDPGHRSCLHDRSVDSTSGEFQLEPGDVVISCTDGVWDQYPNKQDLVDDILQNLNAQEEDNILQNLKNLEDFNAQEIANYMREKIAEVHRGPGPVTKGSKKGNKDDASITVIIIK